MEEPTILTNDEKTPLPPKITKETINSFSETPKGKILQLLRTALYTVLSAALIAISVHCFITPNNFTVGGANGIAVLINAVFPQIPTSALVLCLNLPLLILAFFFVKKRFTFLTAINIGLQSLILFLLESMETSLSIDLTVHFAGDAEKIFAAIAAGLGFGSAIAIAFKVGGSTGGMDIAALLIQKKLAAGSIAWILFAINVSIISASFFVFNTNETDLAIRLLPIMLAVFESYIESKTNESVTDGFQSAYEFRIITDKPEKMAEALMKELSRGVTAIPATGMYTKVSHTMLMCVINRRQIATLRRIMKQIDPDSFAVMSNVSQVLGLGFYTDDLSS